MAGYDQRIMVPQLLTHVCDGEHDALITDYSTFDGETQGYEQDLAHKGYKKCLVHPNRLTESASHLAFKQARNGKIIDVEGGEWYYDGIITSGDPGTQLNGSAVCKNRTRYLLLKQGISPRAIWTLSDDNLSKIGNQYRVSLEQLSRDATSHGWTINSSKCSYSSRKEDLELLGRYASGLYNTREYWKCMRLCRCPEYPVESGSISAYRVKSIMEDAGLATGAMPTIYRGLKNRYGLATPEEAGRHRGFFAFMR